MKKNWMIWVIVLLVVFFAIYTLNKDNTKPILVEEELAKCIGENSMLYVQTGCPACEEQEEMFGDNYKYLNSVNCKIDRVACTTNAITHTPTWVINEEATIGVLSIEELKQKTGCQ